jgi:hypothetical protein
MSREVKAVYQFTHDPKYRLTKERMFIECDDGTMYEFEQPEGNPRPRLRRSFDPDGTVRNNGSHKMLANAVEETVETLFNGWEK